MHYNSTLLPARTSNAQDYWGYYNGATTNNTLIPEVYIPNYWSDTGVSLHQTGADRKVNHTYARAGILEKIDYPLGGNSEFTYQGNQASLSGIDFTDFLPSNATVEDIVEVDNDDLDLSNPSTYFVSKTFTVAANSCSDLNVNNKIFVEAMYPCDGTRNDCQIIIKLDGQELQFDGTRTCVELTPGQHTLSYVTYSSNIPFGSPEPLFYARVTREYVQGTVNPIIDVGGLRVNTIKHNPTSGNPIIKGYEYFDGAILNMPVYGHVRAGVFTCVVGGTGSANYVQTVTVYEKKSVSATPLLTVGGSTVMYQNVHEYTQNSGGVKNGVSKYSYSFENDLIQRTFPFEPSTSLEWKRGNLLKTEHYALDQNNQENKVSEVVYTYQYKDSIGQTGLFPYTSYLSNIPAYNKTYVPFVTQGESKMLVSEEKTDFYSTGNQSTTSSYYYENPSHLQRTKTEMVDSKKDTVVTKMFYPKDVTGVDYFRQ
jgi:hypothetical protein